MITQSYLNELAAYTNNKITKVVLNGTVELSDFWIKEVDDSVVELEVIVYQGVVETVTLIEIKSVADEVIASKSVVLPIVEDTIIRQVITVKEVI